MRYRFRPHKGGYLISATDKPGGQPAYVLCYWPEGLRFAEIRRIFRDELRDQLQRRAS